MTFLRFLSGLTWTDVALILTAWFVIAAALGTFTGLAIRRADRPTPPPPADDVLWCPWLPPVPPTQAQIDAIWLTSQPVDCWLTDELSDRMFVEIVAIEGLEQ